MINFETNRRVISPENLAKTSPQYERGEGIWFSKEDAVNITPTIIYPGKPARHYVHFPKDSIPQERIKDDKEHMYLPSDLHLSGRSRLAQVGVHPIAYNQSIVKFDEHSGLGIVHLVNLGPRPVEIPTGHGVFRFFDTTNAKPLHHDQIKSLISEEDMTFKGKRGAWHFDTEDDHRVLFKVGTKRFQLKEGLRSIDVFSRNVKDIRKYLKRHEYDAVDEEKEAEIIFAYTSFIELPQGYHGVLDPTYKFNDDTQGVHIASTLIEGGVSTGGIVVELAMFNQKRIKDDIWVGMKLYKDSEAN